MQEPTYRDALSHAWHTIWHHKILWIFGLLSLFVGQFGANDFIGKIWMVTKNNFAIGQYHGMFKLGLSTSVALVWIGAIFLALCILILVISIIAEGALIVGASESLSSHHLNFKKAWHQSAKHFWPILTINILRILSMTAVVVITGLLWTPILFSGMPTFLNTIFLIILLAIALMAGLTISSWSIYSLCYSVLDGKGLMKAIKRGWTLFHNHLLVSLELNALLLVVFFILCATFYVIFFLSAAPALILWFIAGITGYAKLITIGIFLWAAVLFILIAFIGAMYNAFTATAWTYLFLKMHNEGIVSRVFHFFNKIVKK